MAFAGHARSLDLSQTPTGTAFIENVHPERHRHIISDQPSPKRANHGPPSRSKSYSAQQEYNKETYGRNQSDDAPLNKVSFNEALASGTDDVGNTPTRSLWIGNVPPGLTDDALRAAFGKYGPILSVRATPSKRCGFVNFEMVDSAIDAWRECHETDIFNTGITVYVRYEKPPSWLKDKHHSLKRKRSANTLVSTPDDSLKRSIPTGPRSQASHSIPSNGPKSQQISISPPPLRRHDTYRPHAQPEEDRTARKAGERHRQNDLYRPSYEDDGEIALSEKRSSIHTRDENLSRDRIYSQGSPLGNGQPANFDLPRSPSLSVISLHSSNRENAAPLLGMGIGIKGLAASRKDSSGNDKRSGLLIKGAAAQNKTAIPDTSGTSSPRSLTAPRKSLPNGEALHSASRSLKDARSAMHEKIQVESLEAEPDEDTTILRNGDSHAGPTLSRDLSAIVKMAIKDKSLSDNLSHLNDGDKQDLPCALQTPKHGFDYLNHLFELKEKEDIAAQKARTSSPEKRLRASSRATTSVESAKTDPTPIHKPLPSILDKCGKCTSPGSVYLKLFKCSVPSCSKKIHFACGNYVSSIDSNSSKQKTKLFCDECLPKNLNISAMSLTNSVTVPDTRDKQNMMLDDIDEETFSQKNGKALYKEREVTYSFVSVDSATVVTNGSAKEKVTPHDDHKHSPKKITQVVDTLSESQHGSETKAAHKKDTQRNQQEPISNLSTRPGHLPPTEPRGMRDGEVDEEALEISIRYKETVTCPWWSKGNKCVRHEKDCMFAHRHTGIESPNGRAVAKKWTCYDFYTPLGCRHLEKECLYSHRDTGLYVGLDGKASKKHLECYWWRNNGRCTFSDSKCTCAHHFTGLVAEEPMPRDVVRRIPHQPSILSLQDADTSMGLYTRSPSYSPPPPPTASSDSLFVAQWPLQMASDEIFKPLQKDDVHMTPKLNPGRAAEAGVDPRLKRITYSGSQLEQLNPQTKIESAQETPSKPNQNSNVDDEQGSRVGTHVAPQQSKQRAMNACENCSKLVFKAKVCTDCLKLGQRRDSEQTTTIELATDLPKMDGSNGEPTPKDAVFAVPLPKVLKRSRTGSSSNLFASKRMRPDMTAIRSTSQSTVTSNGVKPSRPLTLDQLTHISAKKRAKEQARASNDFDSLNVDPSTEKEHPNSPHRPTFSPFTILESPNDISQQSPNFENHKPSRLATVEQGRNDTIEVLREAYGENEQSRSRSESPASNCDSDMPLAELRSRDKPLWSSSTSNQSPQESRNGLKIAVNGVVNASSAQPAPTGNAVRCQTCIKYHRRCVHNNITGELDDRKCYDWQQDRLRLGINHNAHYSGIARDEILKRASQYAAALHGEREVSEVESDEDESDVLDEDEDAHSSSSDEIQKPHNKASRTVYQGPRLSSTIGSPEGESPAINTRPPVHQRSISDVKRAGSNTQTVVALEDQELAGIISRLKAKGAVFEDSDSEDDMDDYELQATDKRIDPLLYHKQKDPPSLPPLRLPTITKGQGLKNPHLIYRRQMLRNFQTFGDPHKEVDRKIPHQEVIAMIEQKDPDDILALPKQFETKVTFQQFLGLQKDKEIESCLGKVSLPRGKFTLGLAFREKEIDPGLGAWGRERRGNRKEKPVYVVGL